MTIDARSTRPDADASADDGATPATPAPETVAADVVCVTCGYALRSLRRDALCPECATPVARSVLHHELVHSAGGVPLALADPAWLRAVRGACAMLLAAAVWKVALYLALFLGGLRLFLPVPIVLRVGLYFLPELLGYVAAWRLAVAEPTAPRASLTRLRVAIRVAVASTALLLVVMVVNVFGGARPKPPMAAAYAGHLVASAAATGLALLYLARLAARGGRRRLARHGVAAAWLSPVLLLPLVPAFEHFQFENVHYQMNPTPGIGYVQVVAPTALRLVRPSTWDVDLWGWVVLAGHGAWSLLLLVAFLALFHDSARRALREVTGAEDVS